MKRLWNPMLNSPKSGRSIYKEDIEKDDMPNSRRYHNRHLSDFLKELDITRCRSIGYLFYFTIGLKSPKSEWTSPTWVDGYPPFSA